MKKLTFLLCALVCAGVLGAQTYYITGNSATLFGASWDPAKMALDAHSDGTYAKTFTTCVIGKEYQFKVTDGTWNNTWGFPNLTSAPEGVTGNSDNNIVCTTYDANMTVVFDPKAGKITLTGVFKDASGEGDPSEIIYSIKHGWKDGQDASWSYKDLTPNGDGTYSIRDIYGGTGCNWKSTISSEKWISNPTLVGSPAKGDSAVFTLDPTAETITITKIVSTAPAVALTVMGDTKLDSEVTLSAAVSNIEGEVTYNYYVKVDEGEFAALEGDNYTFDAAGTYTFKVEAKVGDVVKATDTKEVVIKSGDEPATDIIYFVNVDNWETVYCYAWTNGASDQNAAWPGELATKAGSQVMGKDVYYYESASGQYANCIFHCNGDNCQTEDLTWASGQYYYNGEWKTLAELTAPTVALTVTGDTKLGSAVTLSAAVSNIEGDVTYNYYVKVDEGEFTALEGTNYTFDALGTYTFKVEAKVGDVVKATDTKIVTIAYDWYVRGSFTTNWAVDIKYGMPKNTEGVYSLSFELEAGTYTFKLSKVDTWVGAIGADAVNTDCSDQGWESDDNIKFTLGTAATVTVTYDGEKICLTSTLGKFGQVVITSYTIVGDAAIVGADWNTTNTAADMTDNGDGTWTWEKKDCDLEVKDYTYKVVGNHDYAVYQYPASDANKVLPITEIGTYDIVYTFKPGETPELTAVATKHSSPVTGLQESVVPVIYTRDGRIYGADDMRIYTVLGLDVTNMNGQLNGIYVVKTQAGIVKVVVR